MPPKLRVAVIGLGFIGPRHVQAVLDNPDACLVCVVDTDAVKLARINNVRCFSSCDDMLADDSCKPEAAIICTPNDTHAAVAIRLMEGGVDVLVEKPMAATVETAKEMLAVATRTGRKILVGHHRRFQPCITAARQAMLNLDLGQVIAVNGLWATTKPPEYFGMQWRTTAEAGGPILLNLVHDIDLLQYLLGPITRVAAEETIKQRDYPAEEGAAILLRFASGVVGTFILSDAVASPYSFEQGTGENPALPKTSQDVYRIIGSEATLSVPDMALWNYGPAKKSWHEQMVVQKLECEQITPFDAQVAHLVQVVKHEATPVCSGEAALSAVLVCHAIREALRTGVAVKVESKTG